MKRMWGALLGPAAALMMAGPSLAWTFDTDAAYAWAVQPAASGKFWLVVDCDFEWGEYSLAIETDEKWEATTSYAPQVPITFVVNGEAISTDVFRFGHRGEKLVVELYEYDDAAFDKLYEALPAATGDIEVSYFDKTMRFPAENIKEMFDRLDAECWY